MYPAITWWTVWAALWPICLSRTSSAFRRATLTRVIANSAYLDGIILEEARATNAKFNAASLVGANLTYADFTGVNFNFANLTGANLRFANVAGATFENTVWSNTTCPDGTNSDNHTRCGF